MPARLRSLRADGLLLLVALAWGSTYLAAKDLVGPDTVVALLALRMLVAAPLTIVAVLVVRRRRAAARRLASRGELVVGVILGLLLSAVFLLETFGIAHTSATNAGVVISLTIVFTPILESVVSRIRLPRRFFAAAGASLVGVALLTGGGLDGPGLGDALVLGAAVVRAVHVTTMHRLTSRRSGRGSVPLDPSALTAVQLTTCAVVFGAGSVVFGGDALVGESMATYATRLSPVDLALLLYLAVVCTVFAFVVQMWAVQKTSPTRVSLLLGTEPVWAALIGVLVARDPLDARGWCGVVVILLATAWGRRIEGARLPASTGRADGT